MFTTELILTSDEFDEKLEKRDDGLDYESVTKKTDTKSSCNSMPQKSESWTFVEVSENNQDITDDLKENLKHYECLKDSKTLECTGNNAMEGKMDQNCTILRAQSLKFFEGSKFKRDYEWTSSYFAKENSDVLQRKDKDLNGNYGYLALRNQTESSSAIILEHSTSPLSKLKQHGKPNGIPVLDQQGGRGTSDSSDVNLSAKSCQVISDDTSVISAYEGIKQAYPVSSLHHQHFDQLSSHDAQPSRNATLESEISTNNIDNDTSSDMKEHFDEEHRRVTERVNLWEKKIVSRELNSKLTDAYSGMNDYNTIAAVPSQANSLKLKNHGQEEMIVPVSIQRQPVCYGGLFEDSSTLEEEDGCYGDDGDEIVVIAVCDAGTVDAAANDDDDDGVTIHVNNNETDAISDNIRFTKWHDHDDCDGNDTNMLLGSGYHGNDFDLCHEDDTKGVLDNHHGNDPDGCHGDGRHGDSSKGFLVRNDAIDTQVDDDDAEMIVNGGNPFDLDESEYQKLMQAIHDSFDSLLDDNHPDEAIVLEHNTGSPLESRGLTGKSTKDSSNEQCRINTRHDEGGIIEETITPLDESECNASISDELLWGSEDNQNDDKICVKYHEKDSEQQFQNQTKDNEFASSTHQVQTEESSTSQDSNSVELAETKINYDILHESRSDVEITKSDMYGEDSNNPTDTVHESLLLMSTENSKERDETCLDKDRESQDCTKEQNELTPSDNDFLLKANNGLLDDDVDFEVNEDCQDEMEAVLAETSSNPIEHVKDGMSGEEEEKQEATSLSETESSTKMADAREKEGEMKDAQLPEDDQDQQDLDQSTLPVIVEPSTTSQEDEDQNRIDGNDFVSLLAWHGIVTPQGEEPSVRALSNEDPAASTRDLSFQERIHNINKAFEWVRKELQDMRGVDFNLKVQFDGLRQEARSLREYYEMFVNCEYYDDDEIFDEAKEFTTGEKNISTNPVKENLDKGNPCLDSKPLLQNALREDSGYHSDTPSTSTDTGSTDNDKPHNTSHAHAHAKYYYQPQPTHPKIQELTSSKCVFELQL